MISDEITHVNLDQEFTQLQTNDQGTTHVEPTRFKKQIRPQQIPLTTKNSFQLKQSKTQRQVEMIPEDNNENLIDSDLFTPKRTAFGNLNYHSGISPLEIRRLDTVSDQLDDHMDTEEIKQTEIQSSEDNSNPLILSNLSINRSFISEEGTTKQQYQQQHEQQQQQQQQQQPLKENTCQFPQIWDIVQQQENAYDPDSVPIKPQLLKLLPLAKPNPPLEKTSIKISNDDDEPNKPFVRIRKTGIPSSPVNSMNPPQPPPQNNSFASSFSTEDNNNTMEQKQFRKSHFEKISSILQTQRVICLDSLSQELTESNQRNQEFMKRKQLELTSKLGASIIRESSNENLISQRDYDQTEFDSTERSLTTTTSRRVRTNKRDSAISDVQFNTDTEKRGRRNLDKLISPSSTRGSFFEPFRQKSVNAADSQSHQNFDEYLLSFENGYQKDFRKMIKRTVKEKLSGQQQQMLEINEEHLREFEEVRTFKPQITADYWNQQRDSRPRQGNTLSKDKEKENYTQNSDSRKLQGLQNKRLPRIASNNNKQQLSINNSSQDQLQGTSARIKMHRVSDPSVNFPFSTTSSSCKNQERKFSFVKYNHNEQNIIEDDKNNLAQYNNYSSRGSLTNVYPRPPRNDRQILKQIDRKITNGIEVFEGHLKQNSVDTCQQQTKRDSIYYDEPEFSTIGCDSERSTQVMVSQEQEIGQLDSDRRSLKQINDIEQYYSPGKLRLKPKKSREREQEFFKIYTGNSLNDFIDENGFDSSKRRRNNEKGFLQAAFNSAQQKSRAISEGRRRVRVYNSKLI